MSSANITASQNAAPGPHPAVFSGFLRLAVVLGITALLGLSIGVRLENGGRWLPEVPNEIDAWTAVERPLDDLTVKTLGSPQTLGRQYVNPLDEKIDAHVIATESFDAFHEPGICTPGFGFSLTAETFPMVFGPGKQARAMVLRHDESGTRALMLYWVQYEDGSTTGRGNLRATVDLMPRLTTGFRAASTGQQSVIVRVYTFVSPTDPKAILARRGLYEVARGMYKGIQADGKVWRQRKARAK